MLLFMAYRVLGV